MLIADVRLKVIAWIANSHGNSFLPAPEVLVPLRACQLVGHPRWNIVEDNSQGYICIHWMYEIEENLSDLHEHARLPGRRVFEMIQGHINFVDTESAWYYYFLQDYRE